MRLAGGRWQAGFGMAVLILLAVLPSLYAADSLSLSIAPQASVVCEVPLSSCRVDQIIPFKIIIRSNDRAAAPSYQLPVLPLENLELIDASQSVETRIVSGEQITETVLLFRLKPLSPGRASVGTFRFTYKTSETGMVENFEIEPHYFDIRQKPFFRRVPLQAWIAAACGLGALFFAWMSYSLFLRRKSQALGSVESRETRSLKELDALIENPHRFSDSPGLLAKADDVFRRYLSSRYELVSSKLGGMEILEWIERRRDVEADDKRKIREIIQAVTECRFGGASPRSEEVSRILQKIRDFITAKCVTV